MNLGAHISIAGGIYNALYRGLEDTCAVVQVFVKNQMQWKTKPLSDQDVKEFRAAKRETGIKTVIAHNAYLINLGSPKDELWEKSIDAMVDELSRCEALGIQGLVAHPGSHVGSGEEAGLKRVARGIDEVHKRTRGFKTRVLLETTAGQGSNLGYRFQHLADIIGMLARPERVGVCVDTCHIFAAGYDFRSPGKYAATMDELRGVVGARNIRAFHLNDSKTALGSRVDRHEHIGRGKIGRNGFSLLMNDRRFQRVPMFLETPKEGGMDRKNLRKLRRMRQAGKA